VKRQRVLANFGEFALRNEDFEAVLTEACRLVAEALGTDFAKVLEIDHDRQELLVRAGVNWRPGVVGEKRLPMGERSSETYSIEQGKPVVTKDVREEQRFEVADFMREHGIVAMVNVPIFLPGGRAYGLLQVDNREPRDFAEEDTEFLRTYATILGPVIDRLHKVHDLQVALDANRHLLLELQHRIKNHISVITSLVGMRARSAASEEARRELSAVGERIDTLRLVYEQLYVAGSSDRLPLRPFVTRLVRNLAAMHQSEAAGVEIDIAVGEIELSPEIAVPLGLIINEFVTNSLKHAFGSGKGRIEVRIEALELGAVGVSIADNGRGLRAQPKRSAPGSGTGMRLIEALARQIGAKPDWTSSGGTTLQLSFVRR
jgi:two-component sensor histidine kinase